MKKWFVFWMMTTTLSGACFAQEKPAAKKESPIKQTKEQPVAEVKHESKKLPAIKFSMGMLESGRVDLKYTGFSITDVIGAIEQLASTKKGEFESTADYNARKSAAFATKFLDGSSVEDLFAFVLPVPKGGKFRDGIRYGFNADSGVVNLYALPKSSKYLALNGIGGRIIKLAEM